MSKKKPLWEQSETKENNEDIWEMEEKEEKKYIEKVDKESREKANEILKEEIEEISPIKGNFVDIFAEQSINASLRDRQKRAEPEIRTEYNPQTGKERKYITIKAV